MKKWGHCWFEFCPYHPVVASRISTICPDFELFIASDKAFNQRTKITSAMSIIFSENCKNAILFR